MRTPGRHVSPIHCPQQDEHPDGHWTLLSLETQSADEAPKVHYNETLDTCNDVCVSRAKKILQICKVEEEVVRTNIFRQSGEDCVFGVFHYCEVEARLQHGEGHGACYSMSHPHRKAQVGSTAVASERSVPIAASAPPATLPT